MNDISSFKPPLDLITAFLLSRNLLQEIMRYVLGMFVVASTTDVLTVAAETSLPRNNDAWLPIAVSVNSSLYIIIN